MSGQLFVVVGPSGAGKDTLLAGARAADPNLHWAQRVITRPFVVGGEPFEEISVSAFQARLAAGEFALHWQAHDLHYGVTARALAPLMSGGRVLLNGSRGALAGIKSAFPSMRVIHISAPPEVLAERLAQRGREGARAITARLTRASYAIPVGIPVTDVQNIGTPAQGIARLLQALGA
jgi:ribose 1,5-bisphosphokinase